MTKFKLIVCGATFDHLHRGHKSFLDFLFSVGEKVLIGLTTDTYLRENKVDNAIEPFAVRKKALEKFLHEKGWFDCAEIEPIDSVFISKVWEALPIEAIVVTKDTEKGARIINEKREGQGLKPLEVVVCEMQKAEDNLPISSSRIRAGLIDREGKWNIRPEWFEQTLILTDKLREKLRTPFGKLLQTPDLEKINTGFVVTVGDIVTKTYKDAGLSQQVAIVDFIVQRKVAFGDIKELGFRGSEKIMHVENPAGTLTPELFKTAVRLFWNVQTYPLIVKINGEEDLAVLPVILAAPLGTTILYGQPNVGMVHVEVNEEMKEKAFGLVHEFISEM
ncbi:MAG TPA: pantetheine-phosphate adenylyltransferase [Candidatus Saccharimonadales bacterium]|nr:pantetheine-phosphate adenylyltransferase [Candidatus Saccharimonadales bacterium]